MDTNAEDHESLLSSPAPPSKLPGPRSCLARVRDPQVRTTVMVSLAGIMERMDEQILPALYSAVSQSFNATVPQLGNLTLCRALAQALSSPLGGVLGHYYSRVAVTTAGCTLWGVMTACFSLTTSIHQGMFFWALNGIGLSLVIPAGQSLIADYYLADDRGKAFGMLYLTGAFGGMLGSLYATNMGSHTIYGMEGWRVVFLSVAATSLLIAAANQALSVDPRGRKDSGMAAAPAESEGEAHAERVSVMAVVRHVQNIIRIPTFVIIIVQGIVGSIPWQAMVFFTLYLQLLGMSNFHASLVMSLFIGSTAVGGLLGGWIGDMAGRRFPNHGRIAVTQFSVFAGLPFTLIILKGLPQNGESATVAMYVFTMTTMGVLKSWAGPACNNPIFAEIVPPRLRNMIYAFDRCFEGAIAACAAPLVGQLAERYGFSGTAAKTGDVSTDLEKARALGNALMMFMVVPWTLCLILYTGLHYTYPKDRKVPRPPTLERSLQLHPVRGRPLSPTSPNGPGSRASLPAQSADSAVLTDADDLVKRKKVAKD